MAEPNVVHLKTIIGQPRTMDKLTFLDAAWKIDIPTTILWPKYFSPFTFAWKP